MNESRAFTREPELNTANPNHLRRAGRLTTFMASAAAIAAAMVGCSAPDTVPKHTANHSAEATPSSTPEATKTPELTVESLRIPAGLDADTLGKLIVEDRFTAWDNAGADKGLLDRSMKANLGWDEYLPQIADQNKAIFGQALFGDNWEDIPGMTGLSNALRNSNLETLKRYVETAWDSETHPEDKEAFREWETVDKIDSGPNADGSRTFRMETTLHDNTDMNRIPHFTGSGKRIYQLTVMPVDGSEQITSITIQYIA